MNEAAKSIFQTAANLQAFAKVGFYGPQGSGKTTTAMKIAEGLAQIGETTKPIYFIDTETGSDFFVERMEAAGIPFFQVKTRAFRVLKGAIDEIEAAEGIGVIDSVSHFWDEIKDAFAKKLKRKRLQFQDWAEIKQEWREGYATPFVNSECHLLVCGRVQDIYEDFFDDAGHRDITKTGTRMRAEKEFGFEPSLVMEMATLTTTEDALKAAKDKRERQGVPVSSERLIRATIIKDRADLLNGKEFDFPTFENFLPHFKALNLGGTHLGVDERDSTALFSSGSDAYRRITKKKQITLEEIQGELIAAYPGSDKASKTIKTDVVNAVFGTRSWTAVEEKELGELEIGLKIIRKVLPKIAEDLVPDVEGTVDVMRHEVEQEMPDEDPTT